MIGSSVVVLVVAVVVLVGVGGPAIVAATTLKLESSTVLFHISAFVIGWSSKLGAAVVARALLLP